MVEEGFVSVYRAVNEVTANIVKSALEDAGITTVVQPNNTSWLDGALVPAEGSWGEVLVSVEDAEKAVEILEDYADGQNQDLEQME